MNAAYREARRLILQNIRAVRVARNMARGIHSAHGYNAQIRDLQAAAARVRVYTKREAV